MNTLKFEVYKNTLKRRNGFNPVLGEKKDTKIKCYFMESDWDNCSLVTGNFMSEKKLKPTQKGQRFRCP